MLVPSKILRISKKYLKHQLIRSKIPIISAVQVFSLELHPYFHSTGFFLQIRNTCFQKHLGMLFILFFFFFFDCSVSRIYSLLFLQKIRRPVLLSYNPITFNSKFANRNSCGYCFRHPGKISTKTSALKFSVKLLPANIGFVNYSGLKFFPDFQSTEKLSRGVLQKQLFNIN